MSESTERPTPSRRANLRIGSIDIEYEGDAEAFGKLAGAAIAASLEPIKRFIDELRGEARGDQATGEASPRSPIGFGAPRPGDGGTDGR